MEKSRKIGLTLKKAINLYGSTKLRTTIYHIINLLTFIKRKVQVVQVCQNINCNKVLTYI